MTTALAGNAGASSKASGSLSVKNKSVVITSTSLVIKSILDNFRHLYPDMKLIYDPELEVGSALSKRREAGLGNSAKLPKNPQTPILIFNRSLLERHVALDRRANATAYKDMPVNPHGEISKFNCVLGSFEFKFMYLTPDMSLIEEFEVLYNSNDGITAFKDTTVNLGTDLGDWKFQVDWQFPLEDLSINIDNNYYKGITGSAKIFGWFITARGNSPLILEIHERIYTKSNLYLIEEIVIT